MIHGGIRRFQQRARARCVARIRGDTDACGDGNVDSEVVQPDGIAKCPRALDGPALAAAAQQRAKLVAAVTRGEVDLGNQVRLEQRAQSLKHRVPGSMSEAIVDVLESIGVHEPEAQDAPNLRGLSARDLVAQYVPESAGRKQSGQGVVPYVGPLGFALQRDRVRRGCTLYRENQRIAKRCAEAFGRRNVCNGQQRLPVEHRSGEGKPIGR